MATFVFDIDGTICNTVDGNYVDATPIMHRIEKINELYDTGNIIIFHTARGMGSSKNNVEAAKRMWRDLTLKQLSQWNIRFHDLFFGKPSGDIYIDDKGLSDITFFKDSL